MKFHNLQTYQSYLYKMLRKKCKFVKINVKQNATYLIGIYLIESKNDTNSI